MIVAYHMWILCGRRKDFTEPEVSTTSIIHLLKVTCPMFSTLRAVDLDRQRRKSSLPRNFNQAGWISGRQLKWLTLMGKIMSARVNALLHWLRHCSVNVMSSTCKIPAQPLWLSPFGLLHCTSVPGRAKVEAEERHIQTDASNMGLHNWASAFVVKYSKGI